MRQKKKVEGHCGPGQDAVPLIRALREYAAEDPAYFRIPAHRFVRGVEEYLADLLGEKVFEADLTEAEGLDDLHAAEGVIAESERLAAELWGSEQCFFLVNGSTCGNEAMLLACLRPGEKVLLSRNVHKSVLMGLVLSGAVPVWMQPEQVTEWGPDGPVSADTVFRSLQEHPECRAVLLVSPTYYGVCSPLREIAAVCHGHSIPLLVDEAHGAHLYFMEHAPCGAVAAGADLVVQSVHKTGGSMTQSSLLHVQGDRVDRFRLRESLAMVMSTSPSYVLMASLDGARHQLAVRGRELLSGAFHLAELCRIGLREIPGVEVLDPPFSDPLRVVFTAAACGISGTALQSDLYRVGRISLELSDPVFVVAVITWGNTEQDIARLLRTVRQVMEPRVRAAKEPGEGHLLQASTGTPAVQPKVVLSPREAWYATAENCPLETACGRIAAESVIPYPPGIPVLYPGEEITEEILADLCRLRDTHVSLHGPADKSLHTIRVTKSGGNV